MIRKLSFEELVRTRPTPDEARKLPKHPIFGILDNVRSLHNVGSIFRTADGAGIQKLFLCGMTGTPPKNEIHKTALGAEENVAWEYYQNPVEIVTQLKTSGVQITALEHTTGSVHFQKADFRFPMCLVVGHEHLGISGEVIGLADQAIEIPMYGLKGSLNVGVAFGIAAYQIIWRIENF
jgi:tRNA G18 (ribose-2'-O)-methylase SpoU